VELKKGKKLGELTLIEPTLKRRSDNGKFESAWVCEEEGTHRIKVLTERTLKNRKNLVNPWRSVMRASYNQYQRRCLRDNIYWCLSLEDFEKLTAKNCHYCNKKPENCARKIFTYSGLDRKNNSQGYSSGNTVPCCRECNSIKGAYLSYEEMLVAMRSVARLRSKK
jgi:hypothetical protein